MHCCLYWLCCHTVSWRRRWRKLSQLAFGTRGVTLIFVLLEAAKPLDAWHFAFLRSSFVFFCVSPGFKQFLLHWFYEAEFCRDRVMAGRIQALRGQLILAVVGLRHLEGLAHYLRQAGIQLEISMIDSMISDARTLIQWSLRPCVNLYLGRFDPSVWVRFNPGARCLTRCFIIFKIIQHFDILSIFLVTFGSLFNLIPCYLLNLGVQGAAVFVASYHGAAHPLAPAWHLWKKDEDIEDDRAVRVIANMGFQWTECNLKF